MTPAESAQLRLLLDTLIPPCEKRSLPGAGEIGIAPAIEAAYAETPGMIETLGRSLAALDERARDQAGAGFVKLSPEVREEILQSYAEADPGFLAGILFHTYNRYYAEPTVIEGHGMEGRPPHPLGYELEMGDLDLLDPVRSREPFYRRSSPQRAGR